MIVYIWAAAIFTALVLYFRQVYSRFRKYGVNNETPVPLLGNLTSLVFRLKHPRDIDTDLFNSYPGEKLGSLGEVTEVIAPARGTLERTLNSIATTPDYARIALALHRYDSFWLRFVGRFQFMKPIIFIRDLELVKKITIKDFVYFRDHRHWNIEDTDKYFDRSLFNLRGQEWRDMRSTMSPAFTSSKLKHMIPFIAEVGDQMVRSLKTRLQKSGTNSIEVDVKDLGTRYANDVIASAAFGIMVDSHSEPNNQFYKMSAKATYLGLKQIIKFFGYSTCNLYFKKFKISFFDTDVANFFKQLVASAMENREKHNILRQDMIHLLMEAKKGKLSHDEETGKDADASFSTVKESAVGKRNIKRDWSDDDLIAQVANLLFAGFDTTSIAMSFLLHELALNPDVQERLAQEIKEHEKKEGGEFDYTSIMSMKYMDMVVSESMRLWPPVHIADRICNKDYNLGKPNNKATEDFIVKVGEIIHIPILAFHRNQEYFPNPMKFDPERFSEENIHDMNPFAYMPFGLGPRNCIGLKMNMEKTKIMSNSLVRPIPHKVGDSTLEVVDNYIYLGQTIQLGSRFALCEVKVMVYQILQNFEVLPSERTSITGELSTSDFNTKLKGGHWLKLKARN